MDAGKSFDAQLHAWSLSKIRRVGGALVLFACLLDLAVSVFLRQAPALTHAAHDVKWTAAALREGLLDTEHDTVDVLLLSLLRIAGLGALGLLATKVGKARLDDLVEASEDVALPTEPLLINSSNLHAANGTAAGRDEESGVISGIPRRHQQILVNGRLQAAVDERHMLSYQRKQSAEARKNVLIGAIYLLSTGCQIYLGIKCIRFEGAWAGHPGLRTLQGALMFSVVLTTNLEAFLITRLVNAMTREEGFLVPEFHPHRLFFKARLFGRHTCDKCRNRIHQAYQCSMCNFDCCPACFNKKDKSTGEGIMRSDRGPKNLEQISMGGYMMRGFRLLAPEMPLFAVAILLLLGNSAVRLVLPNFQGAILDGVGKARHSCAPHAPDASQCDEHKQEFYHNVMLYFVFAVATGLISALRQWFFTIVARRIVLHIRERAFASVVTQDIAFFDGMKVGDLQQRLTSDVQRMASPIFSALPTMLSNLVLLFGGLVMCFVTSWRLSMLAFTTVLPIMHITQTYAQWSGKMNREIFQDFADGNAISNETISNVRTVRAVSSEDHELERYGATLAKALSKGVKDATIGSLSTLLSSWLDQGAGVLILWYGGSIAMHPDGNISVGDLIKYQLYYNMMTTSIQQLTGVLNQFTRAAGAAERVLSLMDCKPDIDPFAGAPVDVVVRKWDLKFEHVSFYYQMRPKNIVLRDLSFEVNEGTVCALVGKSGGGKSTIIHLILRYYDPIDGRITLGGVDFTQINPRSVHQRLGVVSQETQLFNATIEENIKYGAPSSVTHEEVEAAAEAAQALKFINGFEDGFATKVGERGQRLSGGQKQRIAIARCLLRKPRLLLLDEATSALDTESESQVQKALDSLIWSGQHTVLLVAHRLSTVVNSNQIYVIDKGTMVEQGNHTQLLERRGVYCALVEHQLQQQREQINE